MHGSYETPTPKNKRPPTTAFSKQAHGGPRGLSMDTAPCDNLDLLAKGVSHFPVGQPLELSTSLVKNIVPLPRLRSRF